MPTVRKIHLTNADGRDATVQFTTSKPGRSPRKGLPGQDVGFRRYLAATDPGMHEALQAREGQDYAQALIDGDPEVDLELVGRTLGETHVVQLSSRGEVLYAAPEVVELILGPDGSERERRAPVDTPANVNDELPLLWTGRMLPKSEAVRRFVFHRSLQLRHTDGLSYDYLFSMAKTLDEAHSLVLLGAGPKGRDPLILSVNGRPSRGFLEGRLEGQRYMLLLHLSDMEMKRPEVSP
jgi:hypothetical protein